MSFSWVLSSSDVYTEFCKVCGRSPSIPPPEPETHAFPGGGRYTYLISPTALLRVPRVAAGIGSLGVINPSLLLHVAWYRFGSKTGRESYSIGSCRLAALVHVWAMAVFQQVSNVRFLQPHPVASETKPQSDHILCMMISFLRIP